MIDPDFVVADEPTSMLDVSIRISIMDLMLNLGSEFGVSYLYITHDLAVARYMCDRIAVMYLGKIVEIADSEELLANPLHPYTKALLSAVPVPDPAIKRAAGRDQGWDRKGHQSSAHLPVPRALPDGDRHLPPTRPSTAGGQGQRSLRGLPPR